MFKYYFDELVIIDKKFSNTTKDAAVYGIKSDNDNNGYRFTDCFTISEVNVPEKCELYPTSLNNNGLKCSKTVKQFNVDPRNENLASIGGCVYSKDGTQFIKYPNGREEKTFYINGPVKELGDYSFRGSNLENLYISSNVEKVGDGALESCYSLKRLYIASPKLKMREEIFWKSLYVDNKAFKLTVGAAKGSEAEEFCRELGIRFLVVEESEVEKFFNMSDEEIFSKTDCQYSTDVITYDVCDDGYKMKISQYNYLTIEVPKNITIEHLSIYCSSLIQIPSRVRSKIKHLEISGSINSIDSMYLEMLENLESITIGSQVAHVNFDRIFRSPNLKRIDMGYAHKKYRTFNSSIYSYDMKELIWYNPYLSEKFYEVLGTVEKIHSRAFAGAKYLESIKLSDNMIELEDEAFADTASLSKVYFGDKIEKIGNDIFGFNAVEDDSHWYHIEVASTSESVIEQIPFHNGMTSKIIKENEIYDFLVGETPFQSPFIF